MPPGWLAGWLARRLSLYLVAHPDPFEGEGPWIDHRDDAFRELHRAAEGGLHRIHPVHVGDGPLVESVGADPILADVQVHPAVPRVLAQAGK